MPYVFTIGNDTGGATKTTCVIELGVALALKGKKVCLIGLDENAELSKYLGIQAETLKQSSTTIFMEKTSANLAFQLPKSRTNVESLWIIPPARDLVKVIRKESKAGQEKILRNYIDNHLTDFDFVIIDTPAGLNMLKINGLYAADFVMIPTRYDYKTTNACLEFIEQIQAVKGESFKSYGILVSVVDLRNTRDIELSKPMIDKFRKNNLVFSTEIPTDSDIKAAQFQNKATHAFNIRSKAGKAYSLLAEEILCYF